MAIVAAGVHATFVDAREFVIGTLGDGQRVDVGAHEQAPARRAVLAISVGRGSAQRRNEAGLEWLLVGDIHGVELAGDIGSGPHLLKAQLGMFMEVAALLDDVWFELGGDVLNRRGDLVGIAVLFVGHDLLCSGLGHGIHLAFRGALRRPRLSAAFYHTP